MGYCYERGPTGKMLLACDACGNAGGVRKRTCPYTVTGDSGRGPRVGLPYCYPAALCKACYAKHKATLHKDCKEAAARQQATYDEKERRLQAGEQAVVAAWGDWQETVPEGKVGVKFAGKGGAGEAWRLVSAEEYGGKERSDWLSGYPSARPWSPHA